MKNKFAIWAIILFFILPVFVYADIGPKPTADITVYYEGNRISDSNFSAKMLTCDYKMKYDQIITDLIPYEKSDWHDKCREIASDYGLDKEDCYSMQNLRGINNLSERARCRDEGCNKLVQKIADNEKACYWTIAPLVWGANCRDSNCHFTYMLPSEFKLTLYIPTLDKIFTTNSISRTNFNSNYDVYLYSDGTAKISETTSIIKKDNIRSFIYAMIITLIIELLVSLIYLAATKLPQKILISVFIADIISLPLVWFILPLIGNNYFMIILLAEIFAVVFEAYYIYYINKKYITFKQSFILSIIMNIASFFIGTFILFFFIIPII